MRGAAIEMASRADWLSTCGNEFDVVFTCDMMNLADFAALSCPQIAALPRIVYFHENQITYPFSVVDERDYHYGLVNITTAMAAQSVWFNSEYHKDDFLAAARDILRKMPDFKCLDRLTQIGEKTQIAAPCISDSIAKLPEAEGPLKIVWAARWEYDKNPEDFFAAVRLLKKRGVDFRLSVTGQSFRNVPEVFAAAGDEFAAHIDHWGFLEDPRQYRDILKESDVFVSTAIHEFFGISAVEAAAAGCSVLVPDKLAYPEVFGEVEQVFYNGKNDLADKLANLAGNRNQLIETAKNCSVCVEKYKWKNNIDRMDDLIEDAANLIR
jgi:glycosyltransferase involved in cell wall biosynthesis